MRYLFPLLLVTCGLHIGNAHGAPQSVSFPVGSVIEVTTEGVTVNFDDGVAAASAGSDAVTDPEPPFVEPSAYCANLDAVTECDQDLNLDSIYAQGGEVAYWTPRYGVLSLPFTTGSRQYTGLFQMTSGERKRDQYGDFIFHGWFSLEPNGAPIEGAKCEYWSARVQQNHYWTQELRYSDEVCRLPDDSVVYYNARLECHPELFDGNCTAEDFSGDRYQFDIAKRAVK